MITPKKALILGFLFIAFFVPDISNPLYAFDIGDTITADIPACAAGYIENAGEDGVVFNYDPDGYYGDIAFRNPNNTTNVIVYESANVRWFMGIDGVVAEWSHYTSDNTDPSALEYTITGFYTPCQDEILPEDGVLANIVYHPVESTSTTPTIDLTYTNYLLSIIASSTATTTNVMYGDWLIMNLWILFFLSLMGLGFFFQLFRKRTGYDRALK